jgi:hypothetical protein
MTHEEKIARWIEPDGIGTEIGAGASPVPGVTPPPIYLDCFKSFGADPNRADFYGHACALPFHDHALDYVIASHVLEHVANPVAALAEWYRVLRPGGIIYLVVPDRRATWEHMRELTPVAHLLEDFVRGTTACDPTHIDEFVFQADWSKYSPETPPEEIPTKQAELARGMHEAVARGEDINIHFHTFEPSNVRELIETLAKSPRANANGPGGLAVPRFNWELVDLTEHFPASSPNGVLAVIRVHKGWRARADATAFRLRTGGDRRAVLRDDAEPFSDWATRTTGLGGVR